MSAARLGSAGASQTRLMLADLLLGELADILMGLVGKVNARAVDVALVARRDRPSVLIMEAHGVPAGQVLEVARALRLGLLQILAASPQFLLYLADVPQSVPLAPASGFLRPR